MSRAARPQLATRFGGTPAPSIPGTQDNPLWRTLRAFYCYDPGPILRRLQTPTLAIFGELDYTRRVLPRANHVQWEAKIGSNGEIASLNGFVPEYFTTVEGWLDQTDVRLRDR
jgi:pimeloyl-ACP methyl ester carboxylesterase